MMRPALLVCALSAALLLCGVRAEGEPYVETSDGNLNLVTAAGKKVRPWPLCLVGGPSLVVSLCWPLLAFAGLCWPLLAFAGL